MGMFDYTAPTMKFVTGQRQGGRVTAVEKYHEREFGSNIPLYWIDGRPGPLTGSSEGLDPVMRWMITVDTGVADTNGETERTIRFNKQRMEQAFAAEAKRLKLREPERLVGWFLYVTKTGQERGRGANLADTWTVELIPGDGSDGAAIEIPTVEVLPAAPARDALRGIRDTNVSQYAAAARTGTAVADNAPPF